jgi:predicted flap endonuclease-1-like 5' DNA nuclease
MTAASSMNEGALDDSADDDSTLSRQSGIVDMLEEAAVARASIARSPSDHSPIDVGAIDQSNVVRTRMDREQVEREASPLASAVESGNNRGEDIDITTDDGPEPTNPGLNGSAQNGSALNGSGLNGSGLNGSAQNGSAQNGSAEGSVDATKPSLDDSIIEVSDEEIETAEPTASYRAPQPSFSSFAPPSSSPASSPRVRSRPPAPPSSRPRSSLNGSSLPPPRPSRPSSSDPWALANKTLELRHATARIVELEELVAFRDARILELEENLAKARRKLEDLEQLYSERRSSEVDRRTGDAKVDRPVVTETRPALVFPMPRPDSRDEGDGDEEFADELARDSDFGSGEGIVAAQNDSQTGAEDDLQQISGIGPRFEAALRKQGITRLSQIAAWSESDVRQVAKALKIPKSRIVKGRWVEVAREVIGTRVASE